MALVRVSDPTDPAASDADWTALIAVVKTMALQLNGGALVVKNASDEIEKGSVFIIGDTVYYADADTAISGTSSAYVQITPSGATATAAFVASLAGVSWNSTYVGWYDGSGNLYVFDEGYALAEGEISEVHSRSVNMAEDGDVYVPGVLTGIGRIEKLTGSGNWSVPAGVRRVKVTMSGGGGGAGGGGGTTRGGDGSAGSETTFTGASSAAPGGRPGAGGRSGSATTGESAIPWGSLYYDGYPIGAIGGNEGGGASGALSGGRGGAGRVVIEVVTVTPGSSIAYSCGAGGSGGSGGTGTYAGGSGADGANGWIILEY